MTGPSESSLQYSASPFFWPLAWAYAAGVRIKNFAYDRRWFASRRLRWPVISVGNLSVGGTGKTPLVLLLANRLQARGWSVDVLSRGYGRSSQKAARVDPLGTPEEFGDEPLLMAHHGLATYVGSDRYEPGRLAERAGAAGEDLSRRVHLLDDGFQHRKLARTIDIVLLQRQDLNGRLLPAGRLREPLSAVRRADICVLRAEDVDLDPELPFRVTRWMQRPDREAAQARLWIVERRTTLPSPATSIGQAVAFCAIGNAHGFFHGLRQAGVDLQASIAFRDHHVYTRKDIERLRSAARSCGAQAFLTTEKDSVRLPAPLRAELEKTGPLLFAGLEIFLREETRCLDTLEKLLQEPLQFQPGNVR